jgi:hypothetical protein
MSALTNASEFAVTEITFCTPFALTTPPNENLSARSKKTGDYGKPDTPIDHTFFCFSRDKDILTDELI